MNKKWIIVAFKRCVYVANSFVFPPSAFGWVTYILRNFLDMKSRLNILIFIFYMKPVPMRYFQSVLVVVPRKNLVKTWDNARTCMVVISRVFNAVHFVDYFIQLKTTSLQFDLKISQFCQLFKISSIWHQCFMYLAFLTIKWLHEKYS